MAYRLRNGGAVSGRTLTISIDEQLGRRPIPNSLYVIPSRNNDEAELGATRHRSSVHSASKRKHRRSESPTRSS
jgi:hypothetical protein